MHLHEVKKQTMTLDEYKRQVVDYLKKREGLTAEEAESWVSENSMYQTADGRQNGQELLSELYAEGCTPQTASEVFWNL